MDYKIIAANWKSHKTIQDASNWLNEFNALIQNKKIDDNKIIVIFASFTLLDFVSRFIKDKNLKIYLGSQDISQFEEGAYTGEINGKQIKELATNVLIGHSEVREYLKQTDEELKNKTKQAIISKLEIIYCVSSITQIIPDGIEILAYEPLSAIGSGKPDNPSDANQICSDLRSKNLNIKYSLYGGSVTPNNVTNFISQKFIDGVLVGKESLNPQIFYQIIKNA